MKHSHIAVLGLGAALAMALASAAAAQSAPTQVLQIHPTDLIQVLPYGIPQPVWVFASPAQLTSQYGYVKNVPLTGFSLIFGNAQSYLGLNPGGTLAAGTVTLAPAPSDGARECIFSTQTITSLTVSANSGQSINNAVTTLSANTGACYLYSASNLTWDRV